MLDFTDSTELLEDHEALRARFADDGYVFLRGVVDPDIVMSTRRAITSVCHAHGWLADGTNPMAAIPGVAPRVEGEAQFFEVYDDVQRLEELHAVPHEPDVRSAMTALLGASAFPHPLSIARLSFPDNDEWATPPHQDYPNNQGTTDLYACWIPLGDCPTSLGSLAILPGSHQYGILPLAGSLGPGHRTVRPDPRLDELEWVGGDFSLGDVVIFHSLTVHRALPNRSGEMRLSVDYRFQREGEPLTEGCLDPHFGRLSWDEIYSGWDRDDLKWYWRDKSYTVAPWDRTLHDIPEDDLYQVIRDWYRWRARYPELGTDPGGSEPASMA